MAIETRTVRDEDELRRVWEMLCRAFGWNAADFERFAPGAPLDRVLAVFDDDVPVACARIRTFGQFFGGKRVALGGYSPVGVAAEHRGRGYGSHVTAAHFPLLREQGEVLAGLYPATTALYRKVGFEIAGVWSRRTVKVRELTRVPAARGIVTRRATDEDRAAIEACYRRVAQHTNGFLDRSAPWWDRIFAASSQQTYVVDGTDGAIDGYVRYSLEWKDAPVATLVVNECMATEPDVLHALWHLVGSSSSIAPDAQLIAPPEHPLFLTLREQEYLTFDYEWRWMARIVDAPGAIAQRGYPRGLNAAVDLRIVDPQCDWNDGRWRFVVDDGEARLEAGGNGDVEIGIGPLSALYTGYATTTTLAAAGLLRTADRDVATGLDAAFAGPTPWMPDFY
jgi:predicted acetyltransferase